MKKSSIHKTIATLVCIVGLVALLAGWVPGGILYFAAVRLTME